MAGSACLIRTSQARLNWASRLAKKLATATIFFLINDSDGWSYRLVDARGKIADFDTLDEDGGNEPGDPWNWTGWVGISSVCNS